jgi:hypothetical protein
MMWQRAGAGAMIVMAALACGAAYARPPSAPAAHGADTLYRSPGFPRAVIAGPANSFRPVHDGPTRLPGQTPPGGGEAMRATSLRSDISRYNAERYGRSAPDTPGSYLLRSAPPFDTSPYHN